VTFCIGLVRDHWALVASDTRTRWREYGADHPEPWAAPIIGVVDAGAKIWPLTTGWLTSGPFRSWTDRAHHAMQRATTLPDLVIAYRGFAGPAMAALEAECPGEARGVRERQSTIVVVRTVNGFAGAHLNWAGEAMFPGADCRAASAFCPDAPRETMGALLNAYQAAVQSERDIRRVVRTTAQLFAAVYATCGSDGAVSPDVAIGLIDDHGPRLIGPVSHAELLGEEVPC